MSQNYGVFSGPYFRVFGLNTERYGVSEYRRYRRYGVFSPNAGKYGPEKTLYLDTFHAVIMFVNPTISSITQLTLSLCYPSAFRNYSDYYLFCAF